MLGMAAHPCDSSTSEVEAGWSGLEGQAGPYETLFQNKQLTGMQPPLAPQAHEPHFYNQDTRGVRL